MFVVLRTNHLHPFLSISLRSGDGVSATKVGQKTNGGCRTSVADGLAELKLDRLNALSMLAVAPEAFRK
jgi:hypothetical protein